MNPQDVKSGANAANVTITEGTEYLVLFKDDSDFWSEHKRVTARTPEAAIKAAVGAKLPDGAAQFVAIPARSWKPVKVTEKVERSFVIAEVKA